MLDIKTTPAELIEVAKEIGKKSGMLTEAVTSGNQHEKEHKEILSKLHKEMPHLGLDKTTHAGKRSGLNYETHEYEHKMADSGSKSHDSILKGLKTHVTFTHHKDEHNNPVTYGSIHHTYNNGYNRHDVASFHVKGNKLHVRDEQTRVTKEV